MANTFKETNSKYGFLIERKQYNDWDTGKIDRKIGFTRRKNYCQ